jgi:GNAT superfamily N-acetyltransferase
MSETWPGVDVGRCTPGAVLPLRHAVLRPHQSRAEDVVFEGDHKPGSAHFCARDAAGMTVCVASVYPEAPPWQEPVVPVTAGSWRLRGMATAPEWRGRGVGSAVLRAVVSHVAAGGGGLFWCNARLGAVAFYTRAGMVTVDGPWEEPFIGPHIAMFMLVEAGQSSPAPGEEPQG